MEYVQGPVTIGRKVASVNNAPIYFKGSIDEIAIYSVALTPDEVEHLYEVPGRLGE
jgi:hypothetical protein